LRECGLSLLLFPAFQSTVIHFPKEMM